MNGYQFSDFIPDLPKEKKKFDQLLDMFLQLLVITSGDVAETLNWMTNLDNQYNITGPNYGMGDFIEELKDKGYLTEDNQTGEFKVSAKGEQKIRKNALEEIFGKLKKSGRGEHKSNFSGFGDELSTEQRRFQFGDKPEQISFTDSIRNAYINHGLDDFMMTEEDLEVVDSEFKTQTSTVLMIDISHSMILYGEDRITPAKKVAMALAEMITKKYKKDTLDIVVFGNDAWTVEIKDLPYLSVGPYHTNTVAGLELSMDLLRRRKNKNKQIFMITDGKPTCLKEGIKYYKNSFGLDPKIMNKTFNLATQCRKLNIPITTFMIASDPYLKQFVRDFTEANKGKAYYSSLKGLGDLIFEDFDRNKRKKI
ncbi:MAG: hypothetical protein AAF363_11370 [Bacteroidota bacterium]